MAGTVFQDSKLPLTLWFRGMWHVTSQKNGISALGQASGHLFQGRYKAIPIATDPRDGGLEYFREVSTYIHLNPFRANLCGVGLSKPLEAYEWSSYPAYCGLARKRPDWLVREKVMKTWGLTEGEDWSLRGYREKLERFMRFEEDPAAGMRGEFEKQIKRGWFIGSEEFRERLDAFLMGRSHNDNFRGDQRQDHGPAEAERLLAMALAELGWNEADLINAASVSPEKQAVAWLLKSQTSVTGAWIALRLNMGHRTNASRAISRFRKAKTQKEKILQKTMLKCTG